MLHRIKSSKYNRLITTLFLILLQFVWFGIMFMELYYNYKFINIVVTVLAVLFVLYIIQKDDTPSMKIGWIVLILILPVIGVPLYLFYGDSKPTRRMYRRITEAQLVSPQKVRQPGETMEALKKLNDRAYGTSKYIYANSGFPVFRNTDVKFYPSGEAMFEDMIPALRSAKKYIFLEYFIFENGKMWDTILSVLLEKANEGVEIKIIYDDFGIIAKHLPKNFDTYLESLHPAINCLKFNSMRPLAIMSMNCRDHRKLMIIDGLTGFTGGVNLADEYINSKTVFGHWKDTGIRLRGDAVRSMTLMFAELWNAFRHDMIFHKSYLSPETPYVQPFYDGFVQPFSDCPLDKETLAKNLIIDMICRARKYVFITTPYLIIDSDLRSVLMIAAKRGVNVRIITPGIPDKKLVYRVTMANCRALFNSGVKIYTYTPGFIHSKEVIVDGNSAMVGTVNLDYRSMYQHFECGVYLCDSRCIGDMEKDFIDTCNVSHQITHSDLKRGIIGRTVDSVLRAFETLL
ncbi:MAG: cardiolipin synthase [Oscillospiraceae bacterium]|nr:cardiolipin synthase [Oscillospiraceae bacterium]